MPPLILLNELVDANTSLNGMQTTGSVSPETSPIGTRVPSSQQPTSAHPLEMITNAVGSDDLSQDPIKYPLCTALHDYKAAGEDELSLKMRQVIIILSKDSKISGDEGWWTGKIGDKVPPYLLTSSSFRSLLTSEIVHSRLASSRPTSSRRRTPLT